MLSTDFTKTLLFKKQKKKSWIFTKFFTKSTSKIFLLFLLCFKQQVHPSLLNPGNDLAMGNIS